MDFFHGSWMAAKISGTASNINLSDMPLVPSELCA